MHEQELYDIYGLWHVPFWQTLLFKIIVGALFFLTLILLVLAFIRRRHARKKELTPWEQALQDLRELREHNIATPEHAQEFYLRLTAILKTYLYMRYQHPVHAKTDHELMHFLYQEKFSPVLLQELQDIFSGMELIKFARGQGASEQIECDMRRSIAFIKKTIPESQSSKK